MEEHDAGRCTDAHHFCVMCGDHAWPDINRLGRCPEDQAKFDPVIPAESGCDYCAEGNRAVDGWHEYQDEELGGGWHVPCSRRPPILHP